MINIIDKSRCCGCNACVQRCPKQCISMIEDKQGFLYPIVDHSVCIKCDICEKVCPILNYNNPQEPLQVLAAKNKNEEQRLKSSSGGIFVLLAEYILRRGGVVFGAKFNKKWEVEHCYVETIEELELLMRSKYVQSKIGNTFNEAEKFLKEGRLVMFVGTSCQISGLKKFLRKEYSSLFTIDFICHGVPSPGIWQKYLEEIKFIQEKKYSKDVPLNSEAVITSINFREKQLGGYDWKKYGFVILSILKSKGKINSISLSTIHNRNIFMKGFLSNLYLRPSCYKCLNKDGASGSDITIADFWGIHNSHPNFDDNKGVSAIFIHTNQGQKIIQKLSLLMETIESTKEEAIASNPSYIQAVPYPANYSVFWKFYNKNKSVHSSVELATRQPLLDIITIRFKHYIKKILLKNK